VSGASQLDYRAIIVVLTALGVLLPFVASKRGIHWAFLVWIGLFFLGFRTLSITGQLRLHPLVVVMLAIFVSVLARSVRSGRPWSWSLPWWLLVFPIFWAWGVVRGVGHVPLDVIVAHASNFIMLFPLWVVAGYVLRAPSDWRQAIAAFFTVGTAIAALGALEYFVPAISVVFPRYMNPKTIRDAVSVSNELCFFERASFSFWGNPAAAFVCVLALPLAVPLWEWNTRWLGRLTIAASVGLAVVAIYISGYRSLWVLLGGTAMVMVVLRRKRTEILITAVVLVVVGLAMPRAGQCRLESVGHMVLGSPTDTSSQKRLARSETSFEQILAHPLGQGWGKSGWVHSDVLQLGADLGVAAGGLFVLGYAATLAALWKRQARDPLALGLVGSFVVLGGLLLTQAVYVLPQLIMPGWLVWAMADLRTRGDDSGPALIAGP
jgi:hypothetical protein